MEPLKNGYTAESKNRVTTTTLPKRIPDMTHTHATDAYTRNTSNNHKLTEPDQR